jgi:alkanesulfonate monooxygenase SsuD/methylene tetrahydromethanopterin reductase-like flavin-dependent oxidoreductase (luciferase family)
MRIGIIILPERDWRLDRERWQRAEAYGFDHAWIYDHLAWRSLADGPWHATVPTLAAAALVTERIRLGTLVTTPNFRHPVPLAKELMTLDVLSEGRLTVALGAGAPGYDAGVLGASPLTPTARHERFVEFRALLDELLCSRVTDWSGTWYDAVGARMIPGPAQDPRPPLLVAAEGQRGMRLAISSARRPGDGWVTLGVAGGAMVSDAEWWAKVSGSVARFDDIFSESEARPDRFVRLLNMESRISTISSLEHLRDHLGRAAALDFTDVALAWPRPTEPFRGDEQLLDLIAEALPELRLLAP